MSFLVMYCISTSPKEINGVVMDKTTQETLTGAKVIINNDTVYTDFDGRFSVITTDSLKKIRVIYPSYETKELSLVRVNQDDMTLSVKK